MSVVGYVRSLDPRLPRAVWALEIGGLVNAFGNGFVYPFLFIYLANVRGFPLGTSGLIVGTNAAVVLVAGAPGGAAADRFGAQRTLMASLALLASGFALFPLVRAPWHAFCLAALIGLANGTFWPSYHALLAAITPAERRHAGYSLQRVSANLGFGVGGALAGLIAVSSRPSTFTALFLIDAGTYVAFLCLLTVVPEGRTGPAQAPGETVGYRAALRDRVFLALLGLNIVFVTAGYAQLETLPVFVKNQADVGEGAIGLVFLVNSLVIVLAKRQRPKIDEYPDYLFVVLHFPVYDKAVQRLNAAELDVFIGQDYLVTLPNVELLPVTRLFLRCEEDETLRDQLFSKGSGYLLYHILDDLFDYCFPILDKIGHKLDSIEDDMFEERAEDVVRDLSNVKQEIISYRKIIKPERSTLRLLERQIERFLPEDLELYFDDIVDASERIWDLLDNFKEVVEALEDTNESVISHRQNDILRTLTVFSVVLLPLTLITGIFGMNVHFPGFETARAFWIICGAMLALAVGLIAFFRKKRWL